MPPSHPTPPCSVLRCARPDLAASLFSPPVAPPPDWLGGFIFVFGAPTSVSHTVTGRRMHCSLERQEASASQGLAADRLRPRAAPPARAHPSPRALAACSRLARPPTPHARKPGAGGRAPAEARGPPPLLQHSQRWHTLNDGAAALRPAVQYHTVRLCLSPARYFSHCFPPSLCAPFWPGVVGPHPRRPRAAGALACAALAGASVRAPDRCREECRPGCATLAP